MYLGRPIHIERMKALKEAEEVVVASIMEAEVHGVAEVGSTRIGQPALYRRREPHFLRVWRVQR